VVVAKLANGGPLAQEVFSKAGSAYVAIALAVIVTIFLRETSSARREAN